MKKAKTTKPRTQLPRSRTKELKLTWRNALKESFAKVSEQVENVLASRPRDLVNAVKTDHDALRQYLKILKNTDRDMTERRRAYTAFSALLKSHTIAEEKVVYDSADNFTGKELHIKIAEGYVEHQVADDLMKRIERAKNSMVWSAHANVLAEVVQHHLDEEERDLLPLVRRKTPADLDQVLLSQYLKLRDQTQKKRTTKNKGVLK